ncbi:MAG: phosphodiester glycosidase family protein [Clostridia bacterium]|nr:phosphodiester glycosidase family protein [Clostridia bacterium]
MKRILLMISLCAMLLFMGSVAICEGEYRTLTVNHYGNDVQQLKERLKELGYFSASGKINNKFTEDTADRIRQFEAACGLPETGLATPALQTLIFSDDAVSKKTGKNASGSTPVLCDISDSLYRNIREGDSGDDVLTFKEALYRLGYFNAKAETSSFNGTMTKAVKALQKDIGLTETGVASAEMQRALLEGTGTIEGKPLPTPAPTATPKPTTTPRLPEETVQLPALNAEGFLADDSAAPFIHSDRNDGHWYYISRNLYIEIIRKYTPRQNITWFETEIRCTPESMPQSLLAQGAKEPGHNFLSPKVIAEQYDAIFAISDDFYGHRWYNKGTQGVIIRNGEIKSEKTLPANNKKWPYLEIIALFDDGSMKVFESDEHTAEEYLAMGVTDTYAFGPILVRDGVIDPSLYDKTIVRYTDDEPRMAMGCIAPYHYIIVSAKGRTNDSDGVTMSWLAERMKALGCENALNLDGGNTVALYFMGDVLNKVVNSTSYRDISSMIGFPAQK